MFVSTLDHMHHAWTLNDSNPFLVMASVNVFRIIVMASIVCRLSVAGSSVGRIGAVLALSLGVTVQLTSTPPLFAEKKKKRRGME